MQTLSVVIITYNEADNIGRLLETVTGWADEIVVVDSFSQDRTPKICRQYPVRFVQREWAGYSATKNLANSLATGDYILSLDADELPDEALRAAVRTFMARGGQVARIKRMSRYMGQWVRYSGWYPDWQIRLFQRGLGRWNGAPVHEKMVFPQGTPIVSIRGHILHYAIASQGQHLDTIKKYSLLRAERYREKGKRIRSFEVPLKRAVQWIKQYVIKGGFLDGRAGWRIARNSGLRYLILLHAQRRRSWPTNGPILFMNTTRTWGGGEKWHLEAAIALHQDDYPVHVLAAPGSPLYQRAVQAGLPVTALTLSKSHAYLPWGKRRARRIIQQLQPRALLLNGSTDLKVGAPAAFRAGVPQIIYRRGLAKAPSPNFRNKKLTHIYCSQVLANSEATRQLLAKNLEFGPHHPGLRTLYNAVPIVKKQVVERPSDRIILANASRFSAQKGHKYFLDLGPALRSSTVPVEIRLAGTGAEEGAFRKKVTEAGLEGVITFCGFQEDIAHFLAQAHIYCCTSEYEGFGFAIAEAMLQEVPVVAFDVSSNPELVQHEYNGLLVPPFDTEAMAQAIHRLIKDPEWAQQLGINGRQYVQAHFSAPRQRAALKALLGLAE